MTTIEDKILRGKTENYCSSSEDDDGEGFVSSEVLPSSSACPKKSSGPSKNTGPKGVLQDWQLFQEHERNVRKAKEKQLESLCKKTALTCLTEKEERLQTEDTDFAELFSDESLTDFIKKRMDIMMQRQSALPLFGEVLEISNSQEYLKLIENTSSDVTIIIHIYDKILECDKMNECLGTVCRDYPYVKFCKIRATDVGVSYAFKTQGVPALLVYKGGELIGNFVGLKEEFGSEFYSGDVENFLIEHGVLKDQHSIPQILQGKN